MCEPVGYMQMVLRKGKTASGSYLTKVDASCYKSGKLRAVLTAGTYTIELASLLWCKRTCDGYSTIGPFNFRTHCKGGCKGKVRTSGKLRVIKPNGGEKHVIGKNVLIRWTTGNAGKYVNIYWVKSGRILWTPLKTRNDGGLTVIMSAGSPIGTDYKVKIQSVTKSHIFDYSDRNYTVKKKGGSPPGAPPSDR